MTIKSNQEANRELKDNPFKEAKHEPNREPIREAKHEAFRESNYGTIRELTNELTHESPQEAIQESSVPNAHFYDLWPQFDAYMKAVIAEAVKQYVAQLKRNSGNTSHDEGDVIPYDE